MINVLAVVLPVVGVTLPEAATAAEARALLEACDRAFQRGGCAEATPDEPEANAELQAVIEWLSPTEARVSVTRVVDALSHEERVPFAVEDAAVERYRALGFTVGTLAAPLAEPEAETETEAQPEAAPIPDPAASPAPVKPKPAEAQPPPVLPPDHELPEPLRDAYLELGAFVGDGVQRPRYGASGHLWVPIYRRWVSELSVGLGTQPETAERLRLWFLSAEAQIGARFALGSVLLSPGVGVQVQQLYARLDDSVDERSVPAFGAVGSLHARFGQGTVAPFFAGRLGVIEETPLNLQTGEGEEERTRRVGSQGPLQFDARAGISIDLGR